jgi:hypothetical protein
MIALIILVTVGGMLYGYLLVRRLDRFIERGGFAEEPDDPIEKDILFYGEREALDEVCRALDGERVSYDLTAEPEIPYGAAYRWVGALSKDDASNLLVCLAARRKNKDIRTIAKCNDRIYEDVFRRTGVTVVLHGDATAHRILACLKG